MGYGGKQAIRSGDIRRFNFTGNGSNTAFDLGFTPATQNQLIVTVNGLVQHYDAFSVTGSTLTFTGTPASGDAIQVTAVVDAVGVAAIPDGAIANVATLTVSGNSTFTGNITGTATFANAVVISSTANVAQGLTANTLTVSTNTATIGTSVYSIANGNVGVGVSSPSSRLEITDTGANGLRLSGGGDHALGFTGYSGNPSVQVFSIRNDGINACYINTQSNTPLVFGVSSGTSFGSTQNHMALDSSGRLTTPYQSLAVVGRSGGDVASQTSPIPYNETITNVGNCWNGSTYRFTAQVAGYYYMSINALANNSTGVEVAIRKNGSATVVNTRGYGNGTSCSAAGIIYLAVSDYVDAKVEGSYAMNGGNGYAYSGMTVYLLG